jgi:hypothetical protein
MKMTVILFQIDYDQFSALAIDLDRPKHIWKARYESLGDLIGNLERAGAITAKEMKKLWDKSWFRKGAPILRPVLNREAIESAGFVQVLPASDRGPQADEI